MDDEMICDVAHPTRGAMGPERHIFLIEDNAGDILLMRQIIEEQSLAIRVHVARDGDQAMLMLTERQFEPDRIVLDRTFRNCRAAGFWRDRSLRLPWLSSVAPRIQPTSRAPSNSALRNSFTSRLTSRNTQTRSPESCGNGCRVKRPLRRMDREDRVKRRSLRRPLACRDGSHSGGSL